MYLRNRLKGVSRNQIQKLIDLGGVKINDHPAKASATVRRDHVLDVLLPPPPAKYLQAQPIPLHVVYEDEHFIVVNKQAGLVVHPARSHLSGTLLNALAHHFMAKAPAPAGTEAAAGSLSTVGADECRPGIVHRLDKNTTGVMVVAKSDTAHWQIARQFEQRTPLKAYLALIHGSIDGVGGVVEAPIGKHPTIREAYAVRHDSSGKPSITLYRVRERYRGYTLVELELKTGRTHQIRVHMSYMGHPLAGDIVYGGEPIGGRELDDPPQAAGARHMTTFARNRQEGLKVESDAAARSDMLLACPALHAALLRFTHPITNQQMTFTAPLHEPLASLLRELRLRKADGPVALEGYWVRMDGGSDEATKRRSDGGEP